MRVIMFQDQFAGKILRGEKRQTIRRKARCKAGDELSLRRWSGKPYRSKQDVILNRRCKAVRSVHIGIGGIAIGDGEPTMLIDSPNVEASACADGFDSFADMLEWFQDVHGLPFEGELIEWSNPPRESALEQRPTPRGCSTADGSTP